MAQHLIETVLEQKSAVPFLSWPEKVETKKPEKEIEKTVCVGLSQIQLLLEHYYEEKNWNGIVRLASQAVVQAIGLEDSDMNAAHLIYCYQFWIMALYHLNDRKSLHILAAHLSKMQCQYPVLDGQFLLCRSLAMTKVTH